MYKERDHQIEKPKSENQWRFDTLHPQAVPTLKFSDNVQFNSDGSYFKGCKWSPDGTYLAAINNGHKVYFFEVPHTLEDLLQNSKNNVTWTPKLTVREGELIYDFLWHPSISGATHNRLLTTSRNAPIHMWNASTGKLEATYKAHTHLDELDAAFSLTMNHDGTKLYAGFKKTIRVFDVHRPGMNYEDRSTFIKEGQSGIISCIAINPVMRDIYAAGAYDGTVATYSEPNGNMQYLFCGTYAGVTHITFSNCGWRLYTGSRMDPEIICWDLRYPSNVLYTLKRPVKTNQRIYFELDPLSRYLISGSHSGEFFVWDLESELDVEEDGADPTFWPSFRYPAHQDTLTGVSLHPKWPVIATCCGQRHYPDYSDSTDSEDSDNETEPAGKTSLSKPVSLPSNDSNSASDANNSCLLFSSSESTNDDANTSVNNKNSNIQSSNSEEQFDAPDVTKTQQTAELVVADTQQLVVPTNADTQQSKIPSITDAQQSIVPVPADTLHFKDNIPMSSDSLVALSSAQSSNCDNLLPRSNRLTSENRITSNEGNKPCIDSTGTASIHVDSAVCRTPAPMEASIKLTLMKFSA